METRPDVRALARQIGDDAKDAVLRWYRNSYGKRNYTTKDLYATWICKVGNHYKVRIDFHGQGKPNMAFDVDVFNEGERVVTAFVIVGFTVFDINSQETQLIGFDDSLI